MISSRRHQPNLRTASIKLPSLEKIIIALTSFFVGSMSMLALGFHTGGCACHHQSSSTSSSLPTKEDERRIEQLVKKRLDQELQRFGCYDNVKKNVSRKSSFFPPTVTRYAVGMARAGKNDFFQEIDTGVPIDKEVKPGQKEVLFLYSRPSALPDVLQAGGKKNQSIGQHINSSSDSFEIIPLLDTKTAIANCDYLNVILTDNTGSRRQCLALVPQYEGYHIQKWMRVVRDKHDGNVYGPLNPQADLTMVSRGYEYNGRQNYLPPQLQNHTQPHWAFLQTYFGALDDILNQLRPICSSIASSRRTIIVMVCNYGQSELLMNFVCAAKRRKLSISNAIVFATDEQTEALAKEMGLATFYDERIFGSLPTKEARFYGDRKFTAMMMAKIVSVHLISLLGYNILFQDVDIIWYKNPLRYFEGRQMKSFDMYFQDDGGHSIRYAPLSANSGFYYIRNNEKTVYFMNAFLMAGDMVARMNSHQQAMIAVLNEHSSLFGLRVKILSRDEPEFPGGYHFNQLTGKYMRAFFAGKVHPFIFHMSWTLNKDNKLLFLRQMGDWYVNDVCIGETVDGIFAQLPNNSTERNVTEALLKPCCAAQPLLSCHYRDKPSKLPCKDSPPKETGKASFW